MSRLARSRRPLLALGAGVLGVVGFAGLASAAGVITLTPDQGVPGTSYVVKVECTQDLTLYGRPLVEAGPPGTLLPLDLDEVAPGTWQIDQVAGEVDDVFGGYCGEDRVEARFDADNPRMYLGPIPETPVGGGQPRTTVEGTDCPTGTKATVTIRSAGGDVTVVVPIDGRGDWSVPLPGPAGTEALTIEASCGSVTYDPITITADTTQPTDDVPPLISPAPSAAVPAAPAPAAPATGAVPVSGTATFTG